MKISALFLLLVLQAAARPTATAQVTLREAGTPLEKVLKTIKKQSAYDLFFDENLVKAKGRPVVINVNNVPVEEALRLVFLGQDNLTYSLNGKIISVKEKSEKKLDPLTEGLNPRLDPAPPPASIDLTVTVVAAENNQPLEGASIIIKGQNKGIVTDINGRATLRAVDPNATVIISFTGYVNQEYKLSNRGINPTTAGASIVVKLMASINELDEVIINKGYYTEKQRFATGNVSTVTSKDIEKQPVSNPLLALQGRVPGMIITQSNGLPGSGVQVQIRGRNSIGNGTLPLYIIDGVPYTSENLNNLVYNILGSSSNAGQRGGNPLSFINPDDIESIDVLKDADATAIFGTRAANGVVLITTKRGKAGKLKFDLNLQTGFAKVPKFIDLLSRREYLDMRYEAYKNDGVNSIPSSATDLTAWDTTRYTDWQKEFIGGTAKYNDIQATLSGGNSNTQYLVGAGYHKETTVFPGDFNNQQASLHFNLNSTSADQKFRFQLSTNYTLNEYRILNSDFTNLALTLAPVAPPIYNSDGTFNWANSTWTNPLASYLNQKLKSRTNNLVSNVMLSYIIIPGLEIKSSFGYTNMQTDEVATNSALGKDPAYWALYGTGLRSSSFVNNKIASWVIEPQISYKKTISKGSLSVLIGSTIQQNTSEGKEIDVQGFNSDLVLEDPKAASIIGLGPTSFAIYKYSAIFGRIGYNWQDKYLINLTGRRDGTSRFGPDRQFHNFGAFGAGWVFSKEEFARNLTFLSFGKLRASYGTTGSDQVGDYSFLDLYSSTSVGVPYQGVTGIQITRLFTPDLAWEQTKKLEGGIELSFLKDRINLSVSHYYNTSSNQLVQYSLSNVAGVSSIFKNLDAKIENKGWEFSLNTVNLNSKDFRWSSTFNIFWNRNKLVSADSGMTAFYKRFVGLSLNASFVYNYSGINPATGLYEIFDSKGNSTATPNAATDKTALIERTPKFTGGFQNTIQYKSFQLDFYIYFVKQQGQDYLYNFVPGYWNSVFGNQPKTVLGRWQKPGDQTNIQRFNADLMAYNAYDNATTLSNKLYTDISFIRLKNVSLSWQAPNLWVRKMHLQNLRLFAQGQNLLTLTKYQGFDPETASVLSLPLLRTITVGVQMVF